ncbi:MAG: hypothetical protein PHC34_07100 [Candidatus Gastranaerophilales bacterium]|nr:hypothetical protein [Candidatus Gastranaerophilales bacterium]
MCDIFNGIFGFIKDLGPTIVGLTGLFIGYLYNKKLLKSKNTDERRKEIYKQLNEFYGPFQQLINKSKHLYQIMIEDKPDNFRTLIALLENYNFSENDKKLIEEIISIGKRTEELILTKSGLIEDNELRELLGKATTHFDIINKSYNKIITGDMDKFKDYVFPRNLDEKIIDNIKKLKDELESLNQV